MTARRNYFLDTEFLEDGKTIDLISIGVVDDEGREFYACNVDGDAHRWNADEWIRANVLSQLPPRAHPLWMTRDVIAKTLAAFVADRPEKPRFWAYYSATDWVAVYQLFGKLLDIPKSWPKHCMDLKQLAVMLGDPKLPDKPEDYEGLHNALIDAKWNRSAYHFLQGVASREGVELSW